MPELVDEPYSDPEQQREAAHLGMWVFLSTEVLFFGGLIAAYVVYRHMYPAAFEEAGRRMAFVLGSVNTAVLLTSSLTMALAVHAAKERRRQALGGLLSATLLLGAAFLVLKAVEYRSHIHEGLFPGRDFRYEGAEPAHAQIFFYLYYVMTGLHALHVTIGVAVLGVVAAMARAGRFERRHTAVELAGLYWHFVDVVWIFLYPLLYQVAPR